MDALAIVILATTVLIGLLLIPLGLPGLWVMVGGIHGGSTRSGWGALIGGLVGAVIGVPVAVVGSVIGAFVGAFIGAALFEYTYSRHAGVATRAGWGAVVGRAAAAAAKIAIGIVIAVIGVFAVLS